MNQEFLDAGRRSTRRISAAIRFALCVASCASANIGLAANSTASSNVLEEVMVTATKRAETVQDIPLSITAISAESLERAGVATFTDYAQKIPNLVYSAASINERRVALRGIYGGGTTGFYIDDMPVSPAVDPRVIDLDRLEVLRGPQGTLYGARSMGGTIRMITSAPSVTDFESRVRAIGNVVDGGDAGYEVSGMVNLPLESAEAGLRMTGYGGRDPGFIERRYPSASDPNSLATDTAGANDFWGAYVSGIWNPVEKLSVRATVLQQKSKLNGWPLSDYNADTLMQTRPFDIDEVARDEWAYGGLTLSYATGFGAITSSSGWFSRHADDVEDFSQYLAYVGASDDLFGTFGVSAEDLLYPSVSNIWAHEHSFTQELRFTSELGGPIEFVAGAFYTRGTRGSFDQLIEPQGWDAFIGNVLGSGPVFGTDLVFFEHSIIREEETAGFGEVTWKFSDAWSATAGVRYSETTIANYDAFAGWGSGGAQTLDAKFKETSTTPKFVIQYKASDDLNLYALGAQGFRPGSSQTPPPAGLPECAANYLEKGLDPSDLSRFEADSLWNYEVGMKSRLLDRRLTLNAAVFYIEWDNIQQESRFECGYEYTVNAGGARSRGAELEIAAVPLDGLNVALGVGYTDAEITKSPEESPIDVGDKVQQIAPWTVSLAVDYSFPLSASLEAYVRADSSYTDRSFSATNGAEEPRMREDYTLLNLRTGVNVGALDVSLFVNNLTNTKANLGDNAASAAELPGRPRYLVNRPRTYGIEAVYQW